MNARKRMLGGIGVTLVALGFVLLVDGRASAHCDTMDGPVVMDARAALEKGDVTAVLKWVPKQSEDEIRTMFRKTLLVRAQGTEARELADMYFFETLVRLHRAGEGFAYTGLKPAGSEVPPVITKADQALEKGEIDELAKAIASAVEKGIRDRFTAASEAMKHAEDSIDAGRKFVAAYVEFVHYVEGIHAAVAGPAHHAHEDNDKSAQRPEESPGQTMHDHAH